MTDAANEVLYEVADHIAVITLNAPERMNTISGPMLNDLARLLTEANEDRNVRVVILTGKGRAFCAGLDLRRERDGNGLSAASSPTTINLRNTPPTVLQAMDKPTICAVNGGAAGYGMDTALGCDIRIMAESSKLAAAFVKRGVVPESGGTWLLPRMLGWAKAVRADLHRPDAQRAASVWNWGLANEVVPDADLMGRARAHRPRNRSQRAARGAGHQAHDADGPQRELLRSRSPRLPPASAAVQDTGHGRGHEGVHGEA